MNVPPYWSGLARRLSPYIPGEQPGDKKFIKLNTNENPYPPSPAVIEAIRRAAGEKLRLYPDPSCTIMREAAAKRWGLKPEQIFCGNGSDEILAFAFAAFFACPGSAESKEPVLFPNITYSFYPVYAALWNIPFRAMPLGKDFSINIEDYKQRSCGVIFPNPNAPTGRALDREALSEIAVFQEKNKKVFIVDEAYIAFAEGKNIGTMIPFINDHPNMLVVRTLSKDASLAGLRSGYAIGSGELIEGLCRIRDSFNSYTVDRLAQSASAAAIADISYYDNINRRICKTRKRTAEALSDMGFTVIPSEANFIFASPPSPVRAAEYLAQLRQRGILIRHFNKPEIENYLRISIGADDDMDIFLSACKEITEKRPA
ncbi:MAG: aminotransferase class I/II-fold pyridoxal phosphate-dependent enzyme [Treponema sp.]|jgi:histidinol-phosphate aminotransferase|nr:aminotransferase class I/II-fold pyridoxal phosphate-dependent enzyme [Treponema sp.]